MRLAGAPPLSRTFPTYQEAVAWVREKEGAITRGANPMTTADKVLVSEVIEWWRKSKTVPYNEDLRLEGLSHDLGKFSVKALNHDRINKYMKAMLDTEIQPQARKKKTHALYDGDRKRKYAPSSVRKYYYTLKKIVEAHAWAHGYPLDQSQFKKQSIPKAWGNKKERRLESDEEKRLFDALDGCYVHKEEWRNLLSFALETGMRAQELLLCEWRHLDTQRRGLFLPSAIVKKTGKHLEGLERTVALSLKALAALEAHMATKRDDEPRIFWQWSGSGPLGQTFRRICKRAGIDNLTIHSLRHEATARLFEKNKLTDAQIMKQTGHTELKTLLGYYKYRPESVAALLDCLPHGTSRPATTPRTSENQQPAERSAGRRRTLPLLSKKPLVWITTLSQSACDSRVQPPRLRQADRQ